jgi:hypothetical protein
MREPFFVFDAGKEYEDKTRERGKEDCERGEANIFGNAKEDDERTKHNREFDNNGDSAIFKFSESLEYTPQEKEKKVKEATADKEKGKAQVS